MFAVRIEVVVLGAIALAAILPGSAAAAPADGRLELEALSTRPEMVTGGNVLVGLRVRGADPESVRVRRNGRAVTSAFTADPGHPRRLTGLVSGLRSGPNLITAFGPGIRRPERLSIRNFPLTGPVFSGPQQEPFHCRTEEAGLGPAVDADCSAPSRVAWLYRTDRDRFKALSDPTGPLPPDGVTTTTRDGRTVDYVVRVESGVIDRSIYEFAVLAPGGEPLEGWNDRLVYSFGGGCSAGYQQGELGSRGAVSDPELSEGYAVLAGTLNIMNTACNDVLSAEAALMLKEHVIEELGSKPVWTMGEGGSGGSVQQQLIAQNYPGILDGILPSASFPDGSGMASNAACDLFLTYFGTADGATLDDEQRKAITGLADPNGCLALGGGASPLNASEGCDKTGVPAGEIFDPVTNPDGIRCTVWDSMVNIFGTDDSGRARRTLDNVGVQYGLGALNDGAIDVKQFLDLNAGVGGFDNDGNWRPERAVANRRALEIAYESGRLNRGLGGYRRIPVLDIRAYVDDQINVHQYVNTYRMRARLDSEFGGHPNQVMWRAEKGASTEAMREAALETLARWMDAIAADRSDRSAAEKVVANKPADAVDACWIDGVRHDGVARIGAQNICEQTLPPHSLPTAVAGEPLDSTVAKCALKPVDRDDYDAAMTNEQWQRLQAVFPNGVCDWTQPGVGERPYGGTWQRFGPASSDAKRKRRISISRRRDHRRGRIVVRASLGPCPQVAWQRLVIEGRARGGHWRRVDAGFASGRRCDFRASFRGRLSGGRPITRVRADAEPVAYFRAARSRAVRLKLGRRRSIPQRKGVRRADSELAISETVDRMVAASPGEVSFEG